MLPLRHAATPYYMITTTTSADQKLEQNVTDLADADGALRTDRVRDGHSDWVIV